MLNLTQHAATREQVAAGVQDLPADWLEVLRNLLTFDEIPSKGLVKDRAYALASLAVEFDGRETGALIGGAPYLMGPLAAALRTVGITPYFAFSRRESVEHTDPDGSVRKTQVFRHLGFVEG